MRLVELLTLLGGLVGTFIGTIATIEQKLIERIKSTSSHSEQKSIELSKLRPISKWRLRQLQKLNVILKTKNGNYLLNEENYKKLRENRFIAVVLFLIVLI